MQILLISANRERMPYPVAPLGLAYIAGALQAAGHDVRAVDLCFSSDLKGDVLQTVEDSHPGVIGISLRNLDNLTYPASISYLPELQDIVAIVRSRTTAPLVIGGSGFSLAPLPLMQRVGADFGVVGEGEEAMVRIVECLEKDIAPHGIPGVLMRGGVEFLPPRPLETFGAPDRGILDNARYLKEGGVWPTSRPRGGAPSTASTAPIPSWRGTGCGCGRCRRL